MLFESEKVKDPVKKDCFGLGFKSVFHVTGKNAFTEAVIYFFLLTAKLATKRPPKRALTPIYTPIHSKTEKSEAII